MLYVRDSMVQTPVSLVADANGDQAVSISILPDFMSASERLKAIKAKS